MDHACETRDFGAFTIKEIQTTTSRRPSWRLQFYSADSHTVKVGSGVKRRGKKSCILREIERGAFLSARMNYGVQSNDYAPARAARDKSYFGVRYIKRDRRRDETGVEEAQPDGPPLRAALFCF